MVVFDITKRKVVAQKVKVARQFYQRMRGLIGARALGQEEGLLITRCQGIHTFGMAFAIDAVFLNSQNVVVRVCPSLAPNTFGPTAFAAKSVLEFPVGTIAKCCVEVGDTLCLLGAEDPPVTEQFGS
ncbi:MAG: DUF192 domain-containing protein [Candidatus Omnitrophota bacterium]|nr:DUF192 domain-containing protein [Candidatus Omnitrophota bacterium]